MDPNEITITNLKILFNTKTGILISMANKFKELYSSLLNNDSIISIDKNESNIVNAYLDSGIKNGIDRFKCIILKYARDDRLEFKSPLIYTDIIEKCTDIQRVETNNKLSKKRYAKPFKYLDIKSFNPLVKLNDFQDLSISSFTSYVEHNNRNTIVNRLRVYNKLIIDSINEYTTPLTNSILDKRIESFCKSTPRNSSMLTRLLETHYLDFSSESGNILKNRVNKILCSAESYIVGQFIRFADITIMLSVQCKDSVYALIDDSNNEAKNNLGVLSIKNKKTIISTIQNIERSSASLYGALKNLATCYKIYYFSHGEQRKISEQNLNECLSTFENFFKQSGGGKKHEILLQYGGNFFGTLKNSVSSFFKGVIDVSKFVTGIVGVFVTLISCIVLGILLKMLEVFIVFSNAQAYGDTQIGYNPIPQAITSGSKKCGKIMLEFIKFAGYTTEEQIIKKQENEISKLAFSFVLKAMSDPVTSVDNLVKYCSNELRQESIETMQITVPDINKPVIIFKNIILFRKILRSIKRNIYSHFLYIKVKTIMNSILNDDIVDSDSKLLLVYKISYLAENKDQFIDMLKYLNMIIIKYNDNDKKNKIKLKEIKGKDTRNASDRIGLYNRLDSDTLEINKLIENLLNNDYYIKAKDLHDELKNRATMSIYGGKIVNKCSKK